MERDYYKAAGVDPAERKIVEESAQAHRASFEGTAKGITEVDNPGLTSVSYRGIDCFVTDLELCPFSNRGSLVYMGINMYAIKP